jgi:hypothetical protein
VRAALDKRTQNGKNIKHLHFIDALSRPELRVKTERPVQEQLYSTCKQPPTVHTYSIYAMPCHAMPQLHPHNSHLCSAHPFT